MKKLIVTIVLFLACVAGYAQTGLYSGGVWKGPVRKTGLVVRPEIGFSFMDYSSFNLSVDGGYQLTPRFYVGGKTGVGIGLDKHYDYMTGSYGRESHIPLLFSTRFYALPTPTSPFLELDLGWEWYSRADGWLYAIAPAFGYSFGPIDAKVSLSVIEFNIFLVSLSVGYNINL